LDRAFVCRVALFVAATALGGCIAYRVARNAEIRAECANLRTYAARMVLGGEQLGGEAAVAIRAIAADGLEPCSDADLAFVRGKVVASEHLRDAGRVRDGKLECSAMEGRLSPPPKIPNPDVVAGRSRTWISAWPAIPNSLHGHVIEVGDIWVAINEQTLKYVEEPPPRIATELLYDRRNHRMLRTLGPYVPLTVEEIAAGKLVERDGVLYQPLCRATTVVCAVASEPISAVADPLAPTLLWKAALGSLAGMLLACVAIVVDLRHRQPEATLRRAVRKGEIALVYQPVVDLRTEAIIGAEALARWTKPNGESVPPETFIALAEANGFIREITRMVMRRVVQELGDLLAENHFRVSLNISAQDLNDPEFPAHLKRCFDSARIPRANIGLELTERATADQLVAIRALSQLKEAGYVLYIDDFGTGYSSLAYLHELSVNAIKIDRAFTRMAYATSVVPVVNQILDMARDLNLDVVVEGIETREQAEFFRNALPDGHGQGWLYSYPLSAGDLRSLLQQNTTARFAERPVAMAARGSAAEPA